jgi:hypothetical protein
MKLSEDREIFPQGSKGYVVRVVAHRRVKTAAAQGMGTIFFWQLT